MLINSLYFGLLLKRLQKGSAGHRVRFSASPLQVRVSFSKPAADYLKSEEEKRKYASSFRVCCYKLRFYHRNLTGSDQSRKAIEYRVIFREDHTPTARWRRTWWTCCWTGSILYRYSLTPVLHWWMYSVLFDPCTPPARGRTTWWTCCTYIVLFNPMYSSC